MLQGVRLHMMVRTDESRHEAWCMLRYGTAMSRHTILRVGVVISLGSIPSLL
jgi:hypothetical protein